MLWPGLGILDDEDGFTDFESGDWIWYPNAGSWVPIRLGRVWQVLGHGGSVIGTFHRQQDRARFIPNRYWRSRGVPDWEVDVVSDDRDGRWLRLITQDGYLVLRQRHHR